MFLIFFENLNEIIEKAFRRARRVSSSLRKKKYESKIEKTKTIELSKINTVYNVVKSNLKKIIDEFPDLNSLPNFYQKLIPLVSDYKKIEDCIYRLKFILRKIDDIYYTVKEKIKRSKKADDIIKARREFYGRVASLLRESEEKYENFIKEATKLRKLPKIKQLPTIAIAGAPNVGKSTLLKKLTGSEPEIKPYPFTTKGLMIGYLETPYTKIQIIDTPGILDRPVEFFNKIELQALYAIKDLSDLIIYVFDLTETCGYPIEYQEKILDQLIKLGIPKKKFVIYYSKTDILNEKEILKKFLDKYSSFPQFDNSNSLRDFIFEWIRKRKDLWK